MPVVAHDIDRLDDVLMLQRASNAKFRRDLLLILPLALTLPLRPELLHRVNRTTMLTRSLDQPDRSTRSTTQHPPPLAVLLRHMHMIRRR